MKVVVDVTLAILLLLIPFYRRVRNRQCAILLTCSDLIKIRESHFTLRVLFQDIPPEKNVYFFKEINLSGAERIIIIIHSFYITQFSALEQTHCAHVACDSE